MSIVQANKAGEIKIHEIFVWIFSKKITWNWLKSVLSVRTQDMSSSGFPQKNQTSNFLTGIHLNSCPDYDLRKKNWLVMTFDEFFLYLLANFYLFGQNLTTLSSSSLVGQSYLVYGTLLFWQDSLTFEFTFQSKT